MGGTDPGGSASQSPAVHHHTACLTPMSSCSAKPRSLPDFCGLLPRMPQLPCLAEPHQHAACSTLTCALLVRCGSLHCCAVAQFRMHPKSGEVVGLFGVFDGARPAMASTAASVRALLLCAPQALRARKECDICCAGHGGSNAAAFVQANLFDSLLANSKFTSDINAAMGERLWVLCTFARVPSAGLPGCRPSTAFLWPLCAFPPASTEQDAVTGAGVAAEEAFVDTDQRYLQADAGENRDDGCTAVTAVLVGQRLVVAHVGDSRAVLLRAGQGAPALPCLAMPVPGRGLAVEVSVAGCASSAQQAGVPRSTGAVNDARAQIAMSCAMRVGPGT